MYKNAMHNTASDKFVVYDDHEGPISSLSVNNPSSEYQALSGLILTSSFDWTVKMWSPNDNKPLNTFENFDDYIYDVQWNPSNPSIFATSNNDGSIDLFDLTKNM
jgi:WD40 repeat protein